jgi:hypothetical protein
VISHSSRSSDLSMTATRTSDPPPSNCRRRFPRSTRGIGHRRVLAEARHAPSLRLCCGNSWPC